MISSPASKAERSGIQWGFGKLLSGRSWPWFCLASYSTGPGVALETKGEASMKDKKDPKFNLIFIDPSKDLPECEKNLDDFLTKTREALAKRYEKHIGQNQYAAIGKITSWDPATHNAVPPIYKLEIRKNEIYIPGKTRFTMTFELPPISSPQDPTPEEPEEEKDPFWLLKKALG